MSEHDCTALGCSEDARWAHQSAMAQGLPAVVTDRAALAPVAALVAAAGAAQRAPITDSTRGEEAGARCGAPTATATGTPDPNASRRERGGRRPSEKTTAPGSEPGAAEERGSNTAAGRR